MNEPEQHLGVCGLVTEDLALSHRRCRGSLPSTPWLKVNRFEDIADLWTEQLPADRRMELLTALALANPATDLLWWTRRTGTVPALRTGSRGLRSWRTTAAGSSPSSSPLLRSRLDRRTYNPERTRDQSVAAIMAIMRGYMVK